MPLPRNPDPYRAARPGEFGVAGPPVTRVGLDIMAAGQAAMDQARGFAGGILADTAAPPPSAPRAPADADIGISADGSQFYVQGQTFDTDDYDNALRAEALIDQPGTGRLPAGFRRMTPEGYRQFTGQVKNPSGWELFTRNFGTGVDVAQQNFGRAAQAFNESMLPEGYTGWGAGVAASNAEEIRKTSPYARPWETSSGGDFLIGTLGQAVPSIIGSLGAAGAGALVGGPWGAAAGAAAYNYPQAVGDIAQRQIDVTGEIDPGAAFGYGVPYALAETAAEAIPVASVLGKLGKAGTVGLRTIGGRGVRGGLAEVGRRLAVGGAAGAVGEGTTEAFQQGMVRAGAGQELWSPEAQAEYLESARAGAAIGGLFGGGARLFSRAPAQTGEPLVPNQPADLLLLPPPGGARDLPSAGGRRPDFYGQSGTDIGPHWGSWRDVQDAEWEAVPPQLQQMSPQLPAPGGQPLLTGPGRPLQIAGPSDPDLFGGSRWTDPGPTPPPPPAGGGGAGLSTQEFYNQTPMGQMIADQLSQEHTFRAPATPERPTSARGGTMEEMLSALTGTPTSDQRQAAEEARLRAMSTAAMTAAGEQAQDELAFGGQPLNAPLPLRRPVADFRSKAMRLLRGRPARAAVPSKAALQTQLNAVIDTMPKLVRDRIKKRLSAPSVSEAKRAKIATEIAKYAEALPASHQPAGTEPEMAFGTSGGVRLKRGVREAAAPVEVAPLGPVPTKADMTQALDAIPEGTITKVIRAKIRSQIRLTKDPDKLRKIAKEIASYSLTRQELGDRLYALQGGMLPNEISEITLALRVAGNDRRKLMAIDAKLDRIEAEAEAEVPVDLRTPEREAGPVIPSSRMEGPRRDVVPLKIERGETPMSLVNERPAPQHDPVREEAIRDELDNLPDSADEYTVMAAHKYLDENNYANAEAFAKAAGQGKAIGRFAMTEQDYEEQKAKQEYRRQQTSPDRDITGGVDEAMALLASAINDLGTGRGKKKAYLTKEQVATLQGLVRGNSSVAQVRARALAYLEANGHTAEALRNALRTRANKQAEAEGKGENAPAPPPKKADPLDAAVDALKAKWGLTPAAPVAKAEEAVVAEAVAMASTNDTDQQVLDILSTDEHEIDRETIADTYGDGLYSAKAKREFLNAYNDVVNKTPGFRERVSKAIRDIIARIQAGVAAIAMVFNPLVLTNPSADFMFTQSAQVGTVETTAPAEANMSAQSALAFARVAPQMGGRTLTIVDKPAGQIHMFDSDGAHIMSGPVLTGLSREDVLPASRLQEGGLSTAEIHQFSAAERVTPAGVFTAKKGGSKHGNILWLDDAQGRHFSVAIHNTYLKDRLPRFTTSGTGDNMVSYGCVNISPEMYEATLKDDIDKFAGGTVVVIPHDLSRVDEFIPEATENVAKQRQEAPLRPPKPERGAADAPPIREEDYLDEPGTPADEARPSPVFSREDTTGFVGDGMAKVDADSALIKEMKGWKARPVTHVHKNWASLPGYYKEQVTATSKGFFDRSTGAVHIIAANIADEADLISTLYHEALGHYGLWNRFTTRLAPMLVKMYQTNTKVQRAADKYLARAELPTNDATIARAVEETLAEWFEPGMVRMTAWRTIKAYVRDMGRAMGWVKAFSDNDVISVMHKAQQYTMASNGPVTMMQHTDATGPAVMLRDTSVAGTIADAPSYLRDNAQSRWTSTRDAGGSGSFRIMLTNQILDDVLPRLGATLAKRVAGLVRNRDAMTNGLMKGAREWASGMENEPLAFRRRSTGIGAPALNNFSGFVETSRRRGKWGFIPTDGRFPADDMDSVEERFRRGEFNAKHEQVADPLIDPELEAAFNKFTPTQQKLIRQFYFETYNHRENERKALFDALNKAYDGSITDANAKVDDLEYELGIMQERAEREGASTLDKTQAKKKAKEYEAAVAKRDDLVAAKQNAARDLINTYRDFEYTPYASMQRHGAFVIIAESRALQAARLAARKAKEAGQKYERPENQPSIYAMEAMPEHRFVHAVDSRHDAVRLKAELEKDADFSGGHVTYNKVADVGQELFKGSDVIAGLSKVIGNVASGGETQATNNIILEIAKRTIIDAMSQNSAKKADLHFRNIRSAPLDMPKAFMSRMLSSSQFLSGHYHNAEINRALADAKDQISDRRFVSAKNHAKAMAGLHEFIGRYNDDLTPKSNDTMADVLTGVSSMWMLMASPSYYAQQAAQNLLITAPYLAGRFGPGATTSAFKIGYAQVAKALKDTGAGKSGVLSYLSNGHLDLTGIDAQYREMLRYLESMGLLDVSANLEMGRVSSDISTGTWDKVMRGVRNSVRLLESNNRISAGIAAFHLMQAQGRVTPETISNLLGVDQKAFNQRYEDYLANHQTMEKYADQAKEPMPPVMSKDEFAAAEYARQVILDTHGDYSSSNKPVWTRQGLGRIATQFRTFNIMMVGTYVKTIRAAWPWNDMTKAERAVAQRTLAYMLGNTALFAGAAGLPVASMFATLLALATGHGDDPEWDYQQILREAVGDPTLSNLLLYGAPSLVGLNVSGSMGMGNLFTMVPGKDAPTDKESFTNWALALLGGPTAATGTRFFDAFDLWYSKGQTYKALQTFVPKFMQGPAQAIHDSMYGEFTRNGIQLMRPEDISAAEKLYGFLGFQSADRSARKWSIGRAIDEEQWFSSAGASIKRNFVEARAAGDAEGMAEARDNWKALQASRQRYGFKQQPISQLGSAARQQAKDTQNVVAGIPYRAGSKGQALKLGQLAGQ